MVHRLAPEEHGRHGGVAVQLVHEAHLLEVLELRLRLRLGSGDLLLQQIEAGVALRVDHAPRHDLHRLGGVSVGGRCAAGLRLAAAGGLGLRSSLLRLLRGKQAPGVEALAGAKLGQAMGEAALVPVAALALLVPDAQRLLVEHVGGAQLLLAVSEGAVRILAAVALHEGHAEPRLTKVGGGLELRARVGEGAVGAVLARALEVVHAELGLVQLVVEARATGLLLRRGSVLGGGAGGSTAGGGAGGSSALVDAHGCRGVIRVRAERSGNPANTT
mmetsp:Transcript_30641/g.66808  ORF Transcript_30641/g.66808 Transcript_30641/m.66808 type:complete len:274 (-) Transcript_30641:12-833(-)